MILRPCSIGHDILIKKKIDVQNCLADHRGEKSSSGDHQRTNPADGERGDPSIDVEPQAAASKVKAI